MACNCGSNNSVIVYTTASVPCPTSTCGCGCTSTTASPCTDNNIDSSNVIYSGFALTCLDIESGATVEEVLQAASQKICEATGSDFSAFDMSCLTNEDDSQITTQQEFVEAISNYVCNLEITHNTFIEEYNTFVTEITQIVEGNNEAGFSNDYLGIAEGDTVSEALEKVADAVEDLDARLDLSSVEWDVCGFTTTTAPTTIPQGFTTILDYICTLESTIPTGSTSLPTFNNIGSCLPGTLTATDTLVATVNKLKEKVCSVDYDLSGLTFGCVTSGSTLEDVLQNMLTRMNLFSRYAFDSSFDISNPGGPCDVFTISVNTAALDRKVSSNGSDLTPGYLVDKLQAGTNITLDDTTTPGKVIIASSGTGDHKVMVNALDPTPGYVIEKIDGVADSSGALTLAVGANGTNDLALITPTFDWEIMGTQLITEITSNPTLTSMWQSFICALDCTSGPTVRFTTYAGLSDKQVQITVTQNVPTLAWYNSGAANISLGTSLNGGPSAITTAATNPQCTITIDNNGITGYNFSIYVTDVFGTPVPASTTVGATPIVAGSPYTHSTFQLGTGATDYVIHIDFV